MDVLSVVIGSGIGLIGILLAVFFYFKQRRVKEPLWSIRTVNLISDRVQKFPQLCITYGNSAVQNLSVSKVAVWNGGSDVIRREDCPSADQLRIEVDHEAQILDVVLLEAIPESCRVSARLSDDRKSALLDFDYLDRQDGAVFQVIHTGKTSKDIAVNGKVLGAGSPKLRKYSRPETTSSSQGPRQQTKAQPPLTLSGMVIAAVIPVGLWIAFFATLTYRLTHDRKLDNGLWILLGIAVPMTLIFGSVVIQGWREMREPKLGRFFEDDF